MVTTHLKSNFSGSFEATRVAQAAILMEEIENFSPIEDDVPLILCGDFNSTPAESVYRLLLKGDVSINPPHSAAVHSSYSRICS